MPAPLRINLNSEEERTLSELRLADHLPQRIRDRAHMLRLNAQGWNVPAIAQIFECHPHTVRTTLKRWQAGGLGGLWEAPGRGAKPKWQASDLDYLSECLENESRTYSSVQLAQKLKQERAVDLSSDRLRRLLKKKVSLETDSPQSSPKPRPSEEGTGTGRPRDLETRSSGGAD